MVRLLWSAAPIALLCATQVQAQTESQTSPAAASASAATAQSAAPVTADTTPSTVGEIVVTARRQVENVQSVAATVNVVSGDRLAAQNVINLTDIAKVLPSINVGSQPDLNQFPVTIRGLGTNGGNPSFDTSVANYVNGGFLSRDRELGASIFDVASLETISGTQATLLGKNSSLGALNLVTTKPGAGYELDLRYGHEFELDSDRIEGGVNIPVSDTLKVRLAGFYDSQGGPVEDVITGKYFRDHRGGGRITAVWTPNDRIDVTALFQGTSDRGSGPRIETELYGPAPGALAAYFGFPNVLSSPFGKNAQYSPALGFDNRQSLDTRLATLVANVRIGEGTLTSQTGYAYSSGNEVANFSDLPGDALTAVLGGPDKSEQFTQELRYSSKIGDRFDYVGGVFYLHSYFKNRVGQSLNYPGVATGFPFPLVLSYTTYFRQPDDAVSVFGQAGYRIFEPLKLTIGLRYTHEVKDGDLSRVSATPLALPSTAPFTLRDPENHVDGSVGLNYQLSRDVLLYASWGQGTKAGGYASSVTDLTQAFYRPEVAQTAEVGFKTQSFGRTLTVNGDIFDTYVRNFQIVNLLGPNFVVGNENVHSDGLELQVNWSPIQGARLYWNNILAYARDAGTGDEIAYAPRWSGLVGASYQHAVFQRLKGDVDVSLDYRTHEFGQTPSNGVPALGGLHRLNLSAGVGDPAKGWEVRLIAQNLLNQRAFDFNAALPLVASPPGQQNVFEIPINPTTVKLQFSLKL